MGRPLVIAAVALLVTAGCGSSSTGAPAAEPSAPVSATSSAPAPASPTASATPPQVTPAAPKAKPTPAATSSRPAEVPETLRFTATSVDGQPFDGASLAGQPTLFWFWAPWCPTCRAQIPQVQDIAKTYADQVQVIGVGSLDGAGAIRGFAEEAAGPTHLTDADGKVWKHFGVAEQSSFVLLDASGKKVFSSGYGGTDGLAERVAEVAG